MADRILTPCSVTPSWHLISPGDCTLQCGMWLWNHDSEFIKGQHPGMWYVALGWHAIEFAQTSAILEFYIWFPHITAVDMSFCTSLRNFIQIGPPSAKKMTSCRFSRWRISAILDCRDPIMGSLKSPCTTSYRSSIETIALNCLVFEKIAFFCILATDRQTDRRTNVQTDGQLRCVKPQSRYRELRLNNIVRLKSGLRVTQSHRKWYHSKALVWFPIRIP